METAEIKIRTPNPSDITKWGTIYDAFTYIHVYEDFDQISNISQRTLKENQ